MKSSSRASPQTHPKAAPLSQPPAGIFSAGFSCLRIDFAKILQFHYKFVAVFLHGYGRIQSETGKNLLKQRTKMRSGSCKEVQAASAPTRKRGKTCKRRSYPTRGSLFASAGFFCKKTCGFFGKKHCVSGAGMI